MSLLRRRLMMTQMESDPIPRERIKFSNVGDEVYLGLTKYNDQPAVFGLAITTHDDGSYYYVFQVATGDSSFSPNEWVSCVRLVKANNTYTGSTGQGGRTVYRDLVIFCNSESYAKSFTTYEEALEYAESININNLPILNKITGKSYVTIHQQSAGMYTNYEVNKDLIDYYYGVI